MVFPLNCPVLDKFSPSDKPQIEEMTACPWQQDCANTPLDFPNFPSNPARQMKFSSRGKSDWKNAMRILMIHGGMQPTWLLLCNPCRLSALK